MIIFSQKISLRTYYKLKFYVFIIFVFLFASCYRRINGIATVTCQDTDYIESSLGMFNLYDMLVPGALIRVDTVNKQLRQVALLKVPDNYYDIYDAKDTVTNLTSINIAINLSDNIKEKVSNVDLFTGEIQSMLKDSAFFQLKACSSKVINDPLGLLNSALSALEIVHRDTLYKSSSPVYMLVSSGIYANNMSIGVTNSKTTSGNAQILRIGNVDLSINYDCINDLKMSSSTTGNNIPIFVNALFYRYDHKTKLFTDEGVFLILKDVETRYSKVLFLN